MSPLPSGGDLLMAERHGGRRSHRNGSKHTMLQYPITTRGGGA